MLSVSGLTLDLPDGSKLFKNLSLTVNQGQTLVIRGPSGCGKTTLLKVIAQLIPFKNGVMTLDGKTPGDLGIPNWRTRILYVPQRPSAMSGTPNDFVDTVRSFASQKKRGPFDDPIEIASHWNLQDEIWDQSFNQLSGGELQRVALAIALAQRPDVLLLDEPTSALDPDTTALVEESLSHFTSLFVTHSPEQEHRVAHDTLTLTARHYGEA